MKEVDFKKFRDEFFDRLNTKTNWGRNEIKEVFHITFENVVSAEIDNKTLEEKK